MFSPPPVFVNKVLLEHCMCLSSRTVSGCPCTTVNTFHTNRVVLKAENTHYVAL